MKENYVRETFYAGNEYKTPAEKKRVLWDRLMLGTRIYFSISYLRILAKNRKVALAGKYNRMAWASSSNDIIKLTEDCGAKYHMEGLDYLHNTQGPVVFVSNHMSTLETMVYPAIIAPDLPTTFVVKESLMTAPIFGPVMRARKPITVKRENVREDLMQVMQQGAEKLKNGISVIIFPQSTRTLTFKPAEFNSMGIKLAQRSGVQVIPVAVKSDFWENGRWIKELGRINRNKSVHIEFGKPFFVTGNGKEDHEKVVSWIEERLNKWNK